MKKKYSTGNIEVVSEEKKGMLYVLNNMSVSEDELLKAAGEAIEILKDNPEFAYISFSAALDGDVVNDFVVTKYMSLEDFKSLVDVCRVSQKNNNGKYNEAFVKFCNGLVKDAVDRAKEESGSEKENG